MKTEYRFASLATMADYFDLTAKTRRESAAGAKSVRARELICEASAFESCAHVARNSTIETAKPLPLPQVSLNGTTRKQLVAQQCDVMHAIDALLKVMHEASPHGRDYQHRPAEFEPAREAWAERWMMIDAMRQEIEAHAIAIQES